MDRDRISLKANEFIYDKGKAIFMKTVTIKNGILNLFSIGYLYIPVLVFFLTWTKWYIAMGASMVSLFGIYKLLKSFDKEDSQNSDSNLTISSYMLITLFVLIILIGIFCGWGGWYPQAGDWNKHNAILNDLVNKRWPVYYENAVEPSMLTYYIGAYLIPAIFGKILSSFRVAEVMFFLWNVIGLYLVLLNMCRIMKANKKKQQLGCITMLFFYNGLLMVG